MNARPATSALRRLRGQRQGFDEFMQGVPDVEPPDFDQLPGGLKDGK